ncbi:MAG: S53 family peptidase [Chloroflexi bacterium]|nr:S53 family peptidase [Chloroflexota bacterium]
MPSKPNFVPVPGSERAPMPGTRAVGAPNPNDRIEVTVRVRQRPANRRGAAQSVAQSAAEAPQLEQRQYMSQAEFAQTFGADPKDIAAVKKFAKTFGLDVVSSSVARRSVVLAGTVEAMTKAFDVDLQEQTAPDAQGTFRVRVGPVNVPSELSGIVEGVFGLDDRPQASPHFRILEPNGSEHIAQARAGGQAYTPIQVAQFYHFPPGFDGSGQTIAIIELGGGYRKRDLTAYFKKLGVKSPAVSAISVDGGKNQPAGDPNSADGEVMLDIEVAGAVATGAKLAVYFAPNTDRGFLDAITTAVHDTRRKPSVISISWGAAESDWTAQAITNMNQAFQEAATLGVTIFCASGDNGSNDGVANNGNPPDRQAHVDFPASSPFAVACGGTFVNATGATIQEETVWNDGVNGGATGGGVSDTFDVPSYQSATKIPKSVNASQRVGRGVPDIAGNASPRSGYLVRVDGKEFPIGGTSAVAPLWAGLTALLNQALGKPIGFLNPLLYQLGGKGILHDITTGNNDITNSGGYPAGPGWDACTGWGSPHGEKLLKALKNGH